MKEYEIVIIGSGAAGLTAGLYASKASKKVIILEENNLGGLTSTIKHIENYPGFPNCTGMQLIQNMFSQASSFGCEFDFVKVTKIDFKNSIIDIESNNSNETSQIRYGALIIAGGSRVKKLNVSGEKKLLGHGVSYCAVCDGSMFKDKNIVIVTDNNSAMSEVTYLSNISKNITILDINKGFKSNDFTVYNEVKVLEINGDNKVSSIKFESFNKTYEIDTDCIFIELGRVVDLSLYEGALDISNNHLCSDENMHTKINNVFVAGDIRDKSLRQIVTACADGAIAATEAVKLVNKK